MKHKYILDISYKGTNYHGWQKQKNTHNTIQHQIEKCLKIIFKENVDITGSGRTDKGVHANHQIAHFEIQYKLDIENIKYKLNAILPFDISINDIKNVNKDFHARFDATLRTYKYFIIQSKDPFLREYALFYNKKLNIHILNELSDILKQEKDFQSFTKKTDNLNNYFCNIKDTFWIRKNNKIIFTISSNRFLRGMVRAIVGTLIKLSHQENYIEKLKEILNKRNRSYAYKSISSKGLFLYKINY